MCYFLGIEERFKITNQENEEGGIGGQDAVVAGDPVERDGAVVFGTEALAAEPNIGSGPEERGEDGLHVAVPPEYGKRGVGSGQGGEGG